MCLGIIWLVVVQAGAKWAVWLAVGGSLLLLLCHMLIFFIDKSYSWTNHLDAKYYTIIALFLLLTFLSVVVCVYRRNLTLSAILLNQSARFLGKFNRSILAYTGIYCHHRNIYWCELCCTLDITNILGYIHWQITSVATMVRQQAITNHPHHPLHMGDSVPQRLL